MTNTQYVVYRYNIATQRITNKAFSKFNRELHNADRVNNLYFNYNISLDILENPYCCDKSKDVIFKHIKKAHLINYIFVNFAPLYRDCQKIDNRKSVLKRNYETAKREQGINKSKTISRSFSVIK